jgi:O-methyltransferase domain/Dimerisation domain
MAVHTDPDAPAADAAAVDAADAATDSAAANPVAAGRTVAAEPAARLAELMDGYLGTQLLFVAAELDLMEALRGEPHPAAEVAVAVGADAATLERVLRGLAAYGVVVEHPGRRFTASAMGELLCADRPGAQRGAMLARGQVYYDALGGLLAAVRSGGVPFEAVHGERFFAHLAAHPELVGAFQASMRDRSAREAAAVVAAYDFAVFGTVVDIGGGGGVLLTAILDAAPDVSGVLFDRPEVAARSPLPAVAGDFFVEVPAGADAYLLSRVIHDWSDADAVAILRTCRRAMTGSARLLLVEAELPERAADHPAAIRMDLHMLALLGGRERTRAEYAALLAEADLELTTVVPADPVSGVHVYEARPA